MLSAILKVRGINYEKTVYNVFPEVKEMLASSGRGGEVSELLDVLGGDALPAAEGLLSALPQEKKNEIICWGINRYRDKIIEKLNELLRGNRYGKDVSLGGIEAVSKGNGICIQVSGIQADYAEIIKEKGGGLAGMVSSKIGDKKLEKMALKMLWTEKNKGKIMNMAERKLSDHGIVMDIEDIDVL